MIWTGVTASAEDAPTVADDTVAAIDDAVGHMLDTAVAVFAADSTVSVGGGVSVDLSSDASDGISIDSPTAGDLEIGLPFADTAGDAQVVDGVMVYDNGNGSSTTPLVQDDGSVQILTMLADADAPTSYEYPFDLAPGASLAMTGQGGVDIVEADGIVSGSIAAPWAIDANGQAVPTHYLVVGDTLTQVIDFDSSTSFPVVADPTFSSGWGLYLHFNVSETGTLATGGWGATFLSGTCAAAASPAGAVVAAAVGLACFATFGAIVYNAGVATRSGKCVYVKWTPGPGAAAVMVSGTYKDKRCK